MGRRTDSPEPFNVGGWSFKDPLTPAEVAKLFRVNPRTVTRWARTGKLTSIKTLGGVRRFSREQVLHLLSKSDTQNSEARGGGEA